MKLRRNYKKNSEGNSKENSERNTKADFDFKKFRWKFSNKSWNEIPQKKTKEIQNEIPKEIPI